jgi:hypothetical protein
MAFLGQKEEKSPRGRREPTESGRLCKNVLGSVWVGSDAQGRTNYHWALNRVNPNDDTKPYRTFRAENLPEVIQACAVLCSAFSRSEHISRELRDELAELSALLEKVEEYRRSRPVVRDGEKGNGEDLSVLGL